MQMPGNITYEESNCYACWEKHPEWYQDILRRMKVIFPNYDPNKGYPANAPEEVLYADLMSHHKVSCVVIVCLDGSQHDYCKPCLLEMAEGIS
jgi:hypothetical protein